VLLEAVEDGLSWKTLENFATLANRPEAKALFLIETLGTDYLLQQCHVPNKWKPQILIYTENFTIFRYSIGL
jgi:hypothetical protein